MASACVLQQDAWRRFRGMPYHALSAQHMLLALYIRTWTAAESLTPAMRQCQVSVSMLRPAQLYPLNWTWTTVAALAPARQAQCIVGPQTLINIKI